MTPFFISLEKLAHHLSATLRGDPNCSISGVASLGKAVSGKITFLRDEQYRPLLQTTSASAVVLSLADVPYYKGNCLIMEKPDLGFAKIAELFVYKPEVKSSIHPTTIIGKNTSISPTATIGAHCVIGDSVQVGMNTIIYAGCVIGDHSSVGKNCILYPRVTLYHHSLIGDRVILHSGVVIGADGFGFIQDDQHWHKIPQLGNVRIGNDVEVGANTAIDRATLEETTLEDGVKLDNFIQVGHNVYIGKHTVIAGGTLIGGSTHIGSHCMIGGGVCIADHVHITNHVILTATTQVSHSIDEVGIYSSGMPAQLNTKWRRNIARFLRLDEIAHRVKKLEKYLL